MSVEKTILENRLAILKTEYITTLTSIERVEKDLSEAKIATAEILGAIKNLELILVQLSQTKPVDDIQKIVEPPKPIEEKIIDKRQTPKKEKK